MNEPAFIICVSQPGCLPESEPFAVHGFERARAALAEEIEATTNAHEVDETSAEVALACANLLDANGACVSLSGYVHEAIPARGPSGCTGRMEDGTLKHDGETCPLHEATVHAN